MNFKDFSLYSDLLGAYDLLPSMSSCADGILKATPDWDLGRVLFVRGRRMILLSVALFEQHIESYGSWIRFLDSLVQVFVLWHAVVLLPRFLVNANYIANTLYSPDMSGRCRDMLYDFGWILTGVLAGCVFVGPLLPLAIYLTVFTPTFHLVVNTGHFLYDYIQRHHTFEKNYADLMPLVIRMGVSVCVVSAAIVILIGSANPVVPFVAAAVAVLATIAGRLLQDYVSKQASKSPHAEQSMFANNTLVGTKKPEKTEEALLSFV